MSVGLSIIHEDETLLVLNKPAGLVCHPTKNGPDSSLAGRVRQVYGEDFATRFVNRLDRETSGLVLMAKDKTAAGELGGLFAGRHMEKTYLAIVHGAPAADSDRLTARLGRDEGSPVAIRDWVREDGVEAATRFTVLKRFRRPEGDFSLLEVRPETGRKHQIRIHLAHAGHPVVGDKLYGADPLAYLALVEGRLDAGHRAGLLLPHQALHAARLAFRWRECDWNFACDPEPAFEDFLDGRPLPEWAEFI